MQPTPNEVVYSGDAAKYAFMETRPEPKDSGLFFCASYEKRCRRLSCESRKVGGSLNPIVIAQFCSTTVANSTDSQRLMAASKIPFPVLGKKSNLSAGPPLS
jgi:hypothetical protein